MQVALLLLPIAAVLGGLVWLRIWSEKRGPRRANTQDHIVEQPGFESGHSSVYRVTRDPVAYARIFHK